MSLINELKRRNVFKVAIAYVVVAWLVTQVLQLVFESFGTPEWVMKTVLVLMAMGLVFALFFAWAFELTPEGLKREHEVDRSKSITRQTGKKLNNTIILVMALAIAYFAYDKFVLSGKREAALAEAATQAVTGPAAGDMLSESDKSVAVLPFVDMSPGQDQAYFTDGLTENLLNALAQLSELKVAGRTSSFAFKGRNEDLRSIGEQLGVANLLEPDLVVLAGESAGNSIFRAALLTALRGEIIPGNIGPQVRTAHLGGDAQVIGAALGVLAD